jgi:anti-sigma B factor antagonist
MNTPKLSITRSGNGSGTEIMHLEGPLVMGTMAEFQQTLRSETAPTVVLDFSGTPFIDSAGLGVLIAIQVHFAHGKRKLVVAGMNDKCRALLKMTNVEAMFPSYATVEDAKKALA